MEAEVNVSQIEFNNLILMAKQMLEERTIPKLRELINLVVKKIIIYKDSVEIHLNFCDLNALKKNLINMDCFCVGLIGEALSAPYRVFLQYLRGFIRHSFLYCFNKRSLRGAVLKICPLCA